MEEADYLCDKIAVIDRGRIKQIASPEELKEKFGGGILLEIAFKNDQRGAFPELTKLLSQHDIQYEVLQEHQKTLKVCLKNSEQEQPLRKILQEKKEELQMDHYNIGSRSFRDVIVNIIGERAN